MRLELISHASLLVTTRGKRILTDPWYFGEIYNGSWALCPPPARLPDRSSIDAVFISHGHPDHFEPRTLTWLLEGTRPDLPIYVARFVFNGMVRELRRIGFRNITEMTPGQTVDAFPGIRFYSQQFRLDDSLLVIQGDETLINLNDTPVRGAVLQDLARRFPRPEYCTAQFAIAQGYPYSYEGVAEADFTSDDLIARFDNYIDALKPQQMIPFASFVRFCAADNQHMNPYRMTIDDLLAKTRHPLTVLYPGDVVENGIVEAAPENREHYEAAQPSTETLPVPASLEPARLEQLLTDFVKRLSRVPGPMRRAFPDVALVVPDLGRAYRLGHRGWSAVSVAIAEQDPIRYTIASDMLGEALEHSWGWEDLSIGARFRARVLPEATKREVHFWLIPMLLGSGYLDWRSMWFLRPRTIRVFWGRRLELWDYFSALLRGRFMSNVVRKKTSALNAS